MHTVCGAEFAFEMCAVGDGEGFHPVVTTLCEPVGACKMLPAVVHSGRYSLYEEPPMVYLDLSLDQVGVLGLHESRESSRDVLGPDLQDAASGGALGAAKSSHGPHANLGCFRQCMLTLRAVLANEQPCSLPGTDEGH